MISKSLAIKVLNAALATGGDYAEIYLEETVTDTVSLENGKVDSCGGNHLHLDERTQYTKIGRVSVRSTASPATYMRRTSSN